MTTAIAIAEYDNAMKNLKIGKQQSLKDAILEYHEMNCKLRESQDNTHVQRDYIDYFDNLVELKLMQLDAINNLLRYLECIKEDEDKNKREKDIKKLSARKQYILKLLDSITVAEDGDKDNLPNIHYI